MKKNWTTPIIALTAGIMLTGSCTSKFDDINTDPDRPPFAPPTNILAYVQRYTSATLFDVWNDMNEPSTYGGHLAKIQYIDEARYKFRPTVVDYKWYYCNLILSNISDLKKKAIEDEATNMLCVAKIWEAMVMGIMTDTWRDVPYSEAFQLEEGVLLPKYDTQEEIYPAMLALLEGAANDLAEGHTDKLGDGDQLYHQNMGKWQKLCNSLRLRLAIRISAVAPDLARKTVEQILGDPSRFPVITANEDNAFFVWPGTSPYTEPWYTDSETRDDHAVSDILVDYLKSTHDPRLPVYAKPNANGEYAGFVIGGATQPSLNTVSRIGSRFRDDKAGFTPYFRACESLFHIAEAAQMGWNTGGITPQEAYERAVCLSLEENGVSDTETRAFVEGNAAFDGTLEQIWWQEWVSLFKQGMEAWSLFRRTGIPSTHYIAPGTSYSGHNTPPFRYPYPTEELSLNGANCRPFHAKVADNFWGQQMWWDMRSDVK